MTEKMENWARYCCLSMLVCLSFTTAGANFSLAAFLVCAIFSKKWQTDFHLIWKNPVAQASVACFAMLFLSQFWADADSALSWAWITKYKKLLIIPLVIPFFQNRQHKVFLIRTVFFSLLLGLLVSYSNFFGWTHIGDCPEIGCTAHTYITLGVLNCLLFVTAFVLRGQATLSLEKWLFSGGALLAGLNVTLISLSRTAQVLLFMLMLILPFFISRSNDADNQKKWWGVGGVLILVAVSMVAIGTLKSSRLLDSLERVAVYRMDAFKSTNNAVSVDVRFEFYRKAAALIAEKPLLGWGSGGHELKLLSLSEKGETDNERYVFSNPHNEYLSWTLQTGLIGLSFFLYWLYAVWRNAMRIERDDERLILQGWLLIFTLGCFLNSFLLDFSEGYMTVLLIAAFQPSHPNREPQ